MSSNMSNSSNASTAAHSHWVSIACALGTSLAAVGTTAFMLSQRQERRISALRTEYDAKLATMQQSILMQQQSQPQQQAWLNRDVMSRDDLAPQGSAASRASSRSPLQLASPVLAPIQQQSQQQQQQFQNRRRSSTNNTLGFSSVASSDLISQHGGSVAQQQLNNGLIPQSLSPTMSPRINSAAGGSKHRSSIDLIRRPAVIVVDPVSTGANVASVFMERGLAVIRLWSGYVNASLQSLIDPTIRTDFCATINHDAADPFKTISIIESLPYSIIGVVSGSELGIEVTDFVTEQIGVPTNGTDLSNARRDKYQMGEQVRRCGVRAVKQARVQSWHEVEQFLSADLKPNPFKVIIKPIRSAGSDNVYLCSSKDELHSKFKLIMGERNQLGMCNDALVVQEFLQGTEYVVDSVSRNGVHKIVALWAYDKRTANGHDFVYYGMASISGTSTIGKQLMSYTRKVLDALSIREGAGHLEAIITPRDGCCLVEVGARCHGCEGTFMPLADRCFGYNQVNCLVAATLSQDEFDLIPDDVGEEMEFGFKIDFVSPVEGVVVRLDHMDEIRKLKSFVKFDVMPEVGSYLHVTIDCFTPAGSVTLCHKDKSIVMSDVETIREYEKTMFVVEKKEVTEADKEATKRF